MICSEKRTVSRQRSSRKTVSFEELIIFKDKYPSIFSRQMEAIVFIILQILKSLNCQNLKVALNPMHRHFAKSSILSWLTKFDNIKIFHRAVFEL